ncbi:MAG TPA: universal stress protein [Mycobacterium sp.]
MTVNAVVGYDGSPESSAAISVGASLFVKSHAWITYLWAPPYASEKVRRRLRPLARDIHELTEMVEREGELEAQRLVAMGVTLARAAGWDAEPHLKRTWGAQGLRFAQVADEVQADLVLVGSRGLGGTQATLGSVSDMVVHYCARPVVVIPHPMLAAEYEALREGPVLLGWDGSAGAERAFTVAARLFPDRNMLLVAVDDKCDAAALPADPAPPGGREILRLDVGRGHGLHGRAISDALAATANDRNAALVVVGSRGRSPAREVLLGSVAMGTLHHSHRPVMVVPREWEAPNAR